MGRHVGTYPGRSSIRIPRFRFVFLDNGDCGPDGSYPLDRSGAARWLLSLLVVFVDSRVDLCPSTVGIVGQTAPIPSTMVGRHGGSYPGRLSVRIPRLSIRGLIRVP